MCPGSSSDLIVEVQAIYQMLENDDKGTTCADFEDDEDSSEFNCHSRCRMNLIRVGIFAKKHLSQHFCSQSVDALRFQLKSWSTKRIWKSIPYAIILNATWSKFFDNIVWLLLYLVTRQQLSPRKIAFKRAAVIASWLGKFWNFLKIYSNVVQIQSQLGGLQRKHFQTRTGRRACPSFASNSNQPCLGLFWSKSKNEHLFN